MPLSWSAGSDETWLGDLPRAGLDQQVSERLRGLRKRRVIELSSDSTFISQQGLGRSINHHISLLPTLSPIRGGRVIQKSKIKTKAPEAHIDCY